MHGGVDRTTAPARHDDAWGRSGGGLRAGSGGVRTGVAVWLFDEAFKLRIDTFGLEGIYPQKVAQFIILCSA